MDRVAIITGAARGIGAATATRLAAQGYRLVLVDRCADDPALSYPLADKGDLDAVVEACGPHARGVVADVRDQQAIDAAVAVAVEEFGGLDAALAVAGCIAGGDDTWTTHEAVWDVMLGVNLEGVWRLANAAVPALLQRPRPREGRFVAVSSAGGTLGLPKLAAYSAAKHGVLGLVRSLAAELGPEGITVNAVAPGSTGTAMLEASAAVYGLVESDEFAVHHLLGRLVEPDEVAAMLAWLCGRDAAAITGAVLPVDAGMTAS
jgi:SDR family mycofactocin-dependent oxidoreductase